MKTKKKFLLTITNLLTNVHQDNFLHETAVKLNLQSEKD